MTKLRLARTQDSDVGLAHSAAATVQPLDADVVVVGAGFAGSLMALLLARQGRSVVVVDPHEIFPDDFRCEKLSAEQASLLAELGVLSAFGADADPLALTRTGLRYGEMVAGLRRLWPASVVHRVGKVTAITPGASRARVSLADGSLLRPKIVLLATGLGEKLRAGLGLERRVLSDGHSVTFGFNLDLSEGQRRALNGLVQRGETAGDGVGYASFFPIGDQLRVNLFLYDDPKSDRVRRFRENPRDELVRALPALTETLAGAAVQGEVELRVSSLYETKPAALDGVVLIGDARKTSCPASGTGILRILHEAKQLSSIYVPRWFEKDRFAGKDIAAFYQDRAQRALDGRCLRRSLTGRQAAVNTGRYWRARRQAQALKLRLTKPRAVPNVAETARPAHTFFSGEPAAVRSAQEILRSLDRDGRLDGTPFMPEMVPFIGKVLTVRRRAERTCVEGHGFRHMDATVFLDAARCDGAAHDGCQRDCALFWKEAWLRPAGEQPKLIDVEAEARAVQALLNLPTRKGEGYVCQSTELVAASAPLSRMHLGALVKDIRNGDLTVPQFAMIALKALVNRACRALKLPEMGLIVGDAGKKVRVELGLQVGERVRIRSPEAVRETLDDRSRNLGLTFEPEMTLHTGQVREVGQVVRRMIHEETGKMIQLKNTVILKDLYCDGVCAKRCPRSNPLFWREAWLERVDGEPDAQA